MPYRNDDPSDDTAAEVAEAMMNKVHDALKTHLSSMSEDQQLAVEDAVMELLHDVYRDAYWDGQADAQRYVD